MKAAGFTNYADVTPAVPRQQNSHPAVPANDQNL